MFKALGDSGVKKPALSTAPGAWRVTLEEAHPGRMHLCNADIEFLKWGGNVSFQLKFFSAFPYSVGPSLLNTFHLPHNLVVLYGQKNE